jgi:tRNA (guanine37-N1)-methyltransferase
MSDNLPSPFSVSVLTMFPEAFPGPLGVSIIGSSWQESHIWSLETVDIRGFSSDKRGFLDDTPAGGGPGQVLKADVIAKALDSLPLGDNRPMLYMSARGRPITQDQVKQWSKASGLVILCGRFEGVDQRVLEARGFDEISVGDAVLAGGESAAMVTIEAVVRLLPGVLGAAQSLENESFEDGLLEHPQYTRPRVFEGLDIPEVLLSGDHKKMSVWRQTMREATTKARRPDLWEKHLSNLQVKGTKASTRMFADKPVTPKMTKD